MDTTRAHVRPLGHDRRHLWGVVLAGGEGVRLRPLVRYVFGDERPKQYAPLLEARSLLRQTLDRVARLVAPERTVVVTLQDHAGYVANELNNGPSFRILVQPEARGTAAGILYPAHWIHAQDPDATLVVFPSDHYVREEALFMTRVADVAAFVGQHSERMVLLGLEPTEAEIEYGWIEPGPRVGWMATAPVYGIRRFREKPAPEVARALFAGGALWNTLVFGAHSATLIEAGRVCLPSLHERLARVPTFLGTEHERWAIRHAFSLAPTANFSRSVLEVSTERLAVTRVNGVTWSDLGTPERVVRACQAFGISPPWLERVAVDGFVRPVAMTG